MKFEGIYPQRAPDGTKAEGESLGEWLDVEGIGKEAVAMTQGRITGRIDKVLDVAIHLKGVFITGVRFEGTKAFLAEWWCKSLPAVNT